MHSVPKSAPPVNGSCANEGTIKTITAGAEGSCLGALTLPRFVRSGTSTLLPSKSFQLKKIPSAGNRVVTGPAAPVRTSLIQIYRIGRLTTQKLVLLLFGLMPAFSAFNLQD